MSTEPYVKGDSLPKRRDHDYGRLNVDGSYYTHTNNVNHSLIQSSSLTGVKNPHWKRQIKLNQQAGTQMSASKVRYNFKPHNSEEVRHYEWKGAEKGSYPKNYFHFGDYFQVVPYSENTDADLVAEANNRAITNLISEANEARQVLQSGELVGELAELVRMVGSPGKSLRNGLGAYIRSIRNRARRRSLLWRQPKHRRADILSRMISDTWLEYKFGWAPLISELDDVIDYYNESDVFKRRDIQAIQGVGKVQDSYWHHGSSSKGQFTFSAPGFKARQRTFVDVVVIYRAQVRMSSSAAGYISEKVGFAPDQWIPTAWELIPYSFLADYFANIGDIIYAASFPRSLLPWIMKTTVVETTCKSVDSTPIWKWAATSGSNSRADWTVSRRLYSMGSAACTVKRVEREPYYGSIVPDFEFSIPNSGTQWLNMAALFAGGRYAQKLLRRLND